MGFIDPWLYFERGAGLTASCLPGQVQDRGLHVLQQVHYSYSQGFILIYWVGLLGCQVSLNFKKCMPDSQRYPVNLYLGKHAEGFFFGKLIFIICGFFGKTTRRILIKNKIQII